MNWKELVGSVAPTIATALGGPLAGAAVQSISNALFGKPNASEAEIEQQVLTASPEILLKLKQAEQEFAVKMKELDISLDQINALDRDSARKREIAVKDKTPMLIALVSFFGFFGILILLIFKQIPDTAKDPLMIMLGALGGIVVSITQYYYGSSSGSAKKSESIEKLMNGKGGK